MTKTVSRRLRRTQLIGLSAVLALGAFALPAYADEVPGETVLFEDGFESGDLEHENGNFKWNDGGLNVNVGVSEDIARTGTHSVKFTYEATVPEEDSWSELRYDMPVPREEVWFQWYQYYPDGAEGLGARWEHRDDIGVDNNKFFLIGNKDWEPGGHSSFNQFTLETEPAGDGDSRSALKWRPNGAPSGEYGVTPINGGGIVNDTIRGRWVEYIAHFKVASGWQQYDAVAELWVDGLQIHNHRNLNTWLIDGGAEDAAFNIFNSGYVMGWANSGFDETSYTYIDDFKVLSTPPDGLDYNPGPEGPAYEINECAAPRGEWIFCDDFESDRLAQYYDYFKRWGRFGRSHTGGLENSGAMTSYYGYYAGDGIVTNPSNANYPYPGNYPDPYGTWLKLAFGKTPDDAVYKPVGEVNEAHRELYYRFYVRNNTEADWNDPSVNPSTGPLARVYGYGPDGTPFMSVEVAYPDETGVLTSTLNVAEFDGGSQPTGTTTAATLVGTTPVMHHTEAGEWRMIEIHAKLNDPGQANGVYELRIDGELESSQSGIDWVGDYTDYGINGIEIYNTNNEAGVPGGDSEYRSFDNLIVSTEPIGHSGAPVENNANLANVKPSEGKLKPYFQPTVTDYTLMLEHGAASATITPTLADEEAAIRVNGVEQAPGTPITIADEAVTIEVTARDGETTRSYTFSAANEAPFLVNECGLNQPGAWLFCDDFEEDRMDSYFERTNQSQFYRTVDVGIGESSGMKAEFRETDGEQFDTGAMKIAFGNTPHDYMDPVAAEGEDLREVYARFYVKHEKDWIGGGGDKLARMSAMQSPEWAQSMIAHVWSGNPNSNDKYKLVAEPARGTTESGELVSTKWNDWDNLYWFGGELAPTPLFDENHVGNWYAVEMRVKLNDPGQSNGIFELWIDDTLETSRTDLNYIGAYDGYGLNWFALENYWNAGTPQDQERYFDNFVLSREKIGLSTAEAEPGGAGAIAAHQDVLLVGEELELTVGVSEGTEPFTALDVTVNYDPSQVEFETVTSGEVVTLAESAIESLLPGFGISSAVKEAEGQIKIIMATAGDDNAVSGDRPVFKLRGQVKDDATAGDTAISLSDMAVSMAGNEQTLDVTASAISIEIVLADKAGLLAIIQSATQLHADASAGSAPGQYPGAAKTALWTAIGAANDVYADSNATQQQVGDAVAALQSAVLTFKQSVHTATPVDFSRLQASITAAEARLASADEGSKLGQHSEASIDALEAAINAAKSVRSNISASQSTVDAAKSELDEAVQTFANSIVSLVEGASSITIRDLSILASYFGVKSGDDNWSEIERGDVMGEGEITIDVIAAVARMILDDWLKQ